MIVMPTFLAFHWLGDDSVGTVPELFIGGMEAPTTGRIRLIQEFDTYVCSLPCTIGTIEPIQPA